MIVDEYGFKLLLFRLLTHVSFNFCFVVELEKMFEEKEVNFTELENAHLDNL